MPNVISGVSSEVLGRRYFRLINGEWYIVKLEASENICFDKFVVGDGRDELITLCASIYQPQVNNADYRFDVILEQGPDYIPEAQLVLYVVGGWPTYITSGGMDRYISHSLFTYRCPHMGMLSFTVLNCYGQLNLLLHSSRYKNKARYDQGGRVTLGENVPVGYRLGKLNRASYEDTTVGEVDVSKLDLGAVMSIKKFATRVAYLSEGAIAGSSAKCYISEDNVEWTKIWEKLDLPITETEEYIEVENITARYIKFTLDANSVVESAHLHQYPLFAWVE